MIPRLTIGAGGRDFSRASTLIVDAALRDPSVLCIDRGELGQLFVFCSDVDDARDVRHLWDTTARLNPALASIELVAASGLILAEQRGMGSQARLARFLAPLLERLRPISLCDADTGADLSDADERLLFHDD